MVGQLRTLLALLAFAVIGSPLRAQEPLPPPPLEFADPESAEPVFDVPDLNSDPQFEHGKPHKVVDAVGWVFGIPKKIVLWDRRAVNHNVSPETEQRLAQYLQDNGLSTTKVRINQYDPVGEWQRLRANKEVGAGWRYTVGAFGTLGYTLIPGRLFGVDRYNPYTDSIYIYSDIPCIAQEQAGHAKLVHGRQHPGTYATVTSLPVVRLWPAKQMKNDVLDYTLATGTPTQQDEATRVLYAEFGAEVGGQASMLVGGNLPLTLAGAGVGHVAARFNSTGPPEPASSEAEPALQPEADSQLSATQASATEETVQR